MLMNVWMYGSPVVQYCLALQQHRKLAKEGRSLIVSQFATVGSHLLGFCHLRDSGDGTRFVRLHSSSHQPSFQNSDSLLLTTAILITEAIATSGALSSGFVDFPHGRREERGSVESPATPAGSR